MESVLNIIKSSHEGHEDKYTLIYHNPVYHNLIEKIFKVQPSQIFHDRLKDYDTYVYEIQA